MKLKYVMVFSNVIVSLLLWATCVLHTSIGNWLVAALFLLGGMLHAGLATHWANRED